MGISILHAAPCKSLRFFYARPSTFNLNKNIFKISLKMLDGLNEGYYLCRKLLIKVMVKTKNHV